MKPRNLVAMAHVESVARSIDFYSKLGFSVRDTFEPEGEDEPTWASLYADRAELMVTHGERSANADERSVLFYLYCDDVAEHGPRSRPRVLPAAR